MDRKCCLAFICALSLSTTIICAQKNFNENVYPEISIRTNPFSVFEIDGGLGAGIEYRWSDRWGAAVDPMFIFLDLLSSRPYNERTRKRGLKLRADARYYLGRPGNWKSLFISPEFHFKYVNARVWETFGINCLQGNCDYYMFTQYRQLKTELGGGLKIGTRIMFSSRFFAEIYTGLGVKVTQIENREIPLGASFENPEGTFQLLRPADGIALPYLPSSIRLALKL
jgi:hypothetical protein